MSEGRRGISIVAIAALVIAIAAAVAGGFIYQHQDNAHSNVASQLKQIRDGQQAAAAARKSMDQLHNRTFGSLTQGLRGLWTAVRGIQTDLRKLDDRLGKLEDKGGGNTAMQDLRKRLKAISARTVLMQARLEALERRAGSRSKTIIVPGRGGGSGATGSGAAAPPGNKTGGARGGAPRGRQTAARTKAQQPPFWNGCIDSLNKSARLATSAESVCDCIVGRISKSDDVAAKDRQTILGQRQFTTRVRGISAGSQKVLEQAVVQCALRQFKNKKKK